MCKKGVVVAPTVDVPDDWEPPNTNLDPPIETPRRQRPYGFVERVDNKLAWTLVRKTNLPFSVVRSLLLRGWSYKEELNKVPVWESPIGRMTEK